MSSVPPSFCLYPFVVGQAFRHKYLEKAPEYIAGHEGVWLTTSDDIAAHYANTTRIWSPDSPLEPIMGEHDAG